MKSGTFDKGGRVGLSYQAKELWVRIHQAIGADPELSSDDVIDACLETIWRTVSRDIKRLDHRRVTVENLSRMWPWFIKMAKDQVDYDIAQAASNRSHLRLVHGGERLWQ